MRLSTAAAVARRDDGQLGWDVPDGWQQGRGAWGGLVVAGAVQALALTEPDPSRALRTLSLHLAAPLPVGPATVRVAPLRLGSGLSTWSLTIEDADGDLCAHAVALTGRERVPELADALLQWGTLDPPALPPWHDVPALPAQAAGMPTFLQHLELRLVDGLPLRGVPARCAGYVRFADQGVWDAGALLSLVDAWWPTALTADLTMRPMATVSYAAHLLVDPATVAPAEPLAYEARMSAAHEGFTTDIRRLWTLDGRLAVENQQSVALIR